MEIIQGEDIFVVVDDKTMLHATSHTLKLDLELKDVRTKHTNGKRKTPGDVTFTVDADGLIAVDTSINDAMTADDIIDVLQSKERVPIVSKSTKSGVMVERSGYGYVTNVTITSPAGDNATYSVSIVGDSELEKVVTPTSQTAQGAPAADPDDDQN